MLPTQHPPVWRTSCILANRKTQAVYLAAYFVKYAPRTLTMPPSHQPTLWRTCRVLANRKRLQILALLIRQPNQTVSTVAHQMRLSLSGASQYLRALEARGLLTCRRVGFRVAYRPAAATTEDAASQILRALQLV